MKPLDAGSLPALPALQDSLSEDEEKQVDMEKALIKAVLREHPQWPLQTKVMQEMWTIQHLAAHAVERIIGADAYRQNAESLWHPAKYNPPQLMASIRPSRRASNRVMAWAGAARSGPNDIKRPHLPSVVRAECAGAGVGQGDRNVPPQKSPRAQLAQRKPISQRKRAESGSKAPTAAAAYRQKKAGKKGGLFGELGDYPEGCERVNQLMLLLSEQKKTEVEVVLKLAMPPLQNSMLDSA